MDHAQYVNKVGKQINDSTKMNVDIDNTSVTNIVLIPHLETIYNQLESDLKKNDPDFPFTQEGLDDSMEWISQEFENRKDYWMQMEKDKMKMILQERGDS